MGYLLKPICRRLVHIPAADFSRTSKHSPTLNLRNPSRFRRQHRGALQDPTEIDWTALLRLAAAHAVTPMLYAALRDQSIPEAVQENLRCALEESVRRMAQSGEFARVAGLFEERGIPMVALKGPLLSRYLYGDLGARTSGDIDLLAKPKDVARIHAY